MRLTETCACGAKLETTGIQAPSQAESFRNAHEPCRQKRESSGETLEAMHRAHEREQEIDLMLREAIRTLIETGGGTVTRQRGVELQARYEELGAS